MFLDRQDNRKQVEQAYRKQLKTEVDNKRSRIISNKNQQYLPEKQSFSLITNIQKEQLQRKKKNEQYYEDLRMQMELQKQEKQQQEAQKKRKQLEQQNKIKEQQRKLQQRYDEQIKKENKNKKNVAPEVKLDLVQQKPKKRKQISINRQSQPVKRQLPHKVIAQQRVIMNQPQPINLGLQSNYDTYSLPQANLYPNKVQNETYNYVPRNLYKDNYYKELLGQRRRLEEEANQISQLNRIFNAERYKRREESRGLEELRNLQKMLDNKNSDYLDISHDPKPNNYESNKLKTLNKVLRSSTFSQKANKDEWRKLD